MRKAMIAAVAALAGMSTNAYAADMNGGSYKDEPVAYETTKTWTGFYIGAGIGAGASVTELSVNEYRKSYDEYPSYDTLAVASESGPEFEKTQIIGFDGIGGEGIFGTVQLGYDRQLSNRFVIGAFVDYDFSNISSDLDINLGYGEGFHGELELENSWSVGARIGWLATPDTLWYVLAAYTQASYDVSDNAGLSSALDIDDFKGWSVGLGAETRLSDNWSLKGEYRFTQFDEETIFSAIDDCGGIDVEMEPSVHTARLVLSYRINPFERSLDSMK